MVQRRGSETALLLVDFLNLLVGEAGRYLPSAAMKAAAHAAFLKSKLKRCPVIYANDHFGDWRSDFPALIKACKVRPGCASKLVQILEPKPGDYSILKPRHSAFYGTPLEFLLQELNIRRLVIVGMETDVCVLYTAHDAYMRKFQLWIPRDCVASRSPSRHTAALEFMTANLKADTKMSRHSADE